MSRKNANLLVVLLALGLAHTTSADEIAASVVTAGAPGGTVFSTQGWSFTPQKNLRVTRLGMVDVGGDGFGESHEVGIWSSTGTLLAAATIPSGVTAPLTATTRFVAIAPILLARNQTYVVGAYYPGSADTILNDGINGSNIDYHAALTSGSGRFGINQFSGLAFPDITSGLPRLGPNFQFTIAADRTWPTDPAPCNDITNLAACIEAASPDDIIEIAANAIPAQNVYVNTPKGFTLRPASGFSPVFASLTRFFIPGGDTAATIVIEGLTLAEGELRIALGTGPLNVTLRGNSIQQVFNNGIEVSNRSGQTTVTIEDNDLAANTPSEVYSIFVWGLDGADNVVRIADNRITQIGGGQGSALEFANNVGTGTVDIIGNRITGAGFNHGINFYQYGAGDIDARIVNNVVSGQENVAGGPGAIAVNVTGTVSVELVNNTVAHNEIGILISGNPDAALSALVANNIVAFNQQSGMNFESYYEGVIRNEFNLVHGNAEDNYTPGPGTLTAGPAFVSLTDLRPQPGSPAENSGSGGRVPADITTDVAGNARIQGLVDRGAYEVATGGIDTDLDGIGDPLDNCTLVQNLNQRDTNADGYGNICDGDLNNSGLTNVLDYNILRGRMNSADPDADLNDSGLVTILDFNIFRGLLNEPPGPSGLSP